MTGRKGGKSLYKVRTKAQRTAATHPSDDWGQPKIKTQQGRQSIKTGVQFWTTSM